MDAPLSEKEIKMLSLQLKSGEYFTIGDDITVQIFEKSGSLFKVSIQAPREMQILRGSLHERTGERPDSVFDERSKSPSEQRWEAKRKQRET